MKRNKSFILVVVIFIFALVYLHQKVLISVETYQLSSNYQTYNELVDKRDFMMYNFIQKVSLPKVNKWAETNDFLPIEKGRLLALNIKREQTESRDSKIAFIFNRFLGISTAASTALAKDSQ